MSETTHPRFKRSTNDDWLTPPGIVQALGPFDLDPCASEHQPWPTAKEHMTIADDGLTRPWNGFVWLNPPYSTPGPWVERLAKHPAGGIALVFARTECRWFQEQVWGAAHAVFFIAGRLRFHRAVSGEQAKLNAPAPSVLVAYGPEAATLLELYTPELGGHFVRLRPAGGLQ